MESDHFRKEFVCVDLETTHLDFREGRIMEAAAVRAELFYDDQEKKFKVDFQDDFDSLVNPEIEVPQMALQITGIKPDDLDEAKTWKEVKKQFESFIHEETVVGHNIGFDLGYLENQGLKLKNERLDTLELSQTLLPVSASHSLEALAESLGVQIGVSHRALEDCKTTLLVLSEVLNQFLLLPLPVQDQVKAILNNADSSTLAVVEGLPRVELKGVSTQSPLSIDLEPEKIDLDFEDSTIYKTPIVFNKQQEWLKYLSQQKEELLVGISNPFYLDAVSQEQRLASPKRSLCTVKFEDFLKTDELSDIAKKSLVKVVIFRYFFKNVDLGKVKFTPEERRILTGLKVDRDSCPEHKCEFIKSIELTRDKPLFIDLSSLFSLAEKWNSDLKQKKAVLFDLAEIEEGFIEAASSTLNLRRAREILSVVYPVESKSFSYLEEMPKEAEGFLNELDLFFGILHLVYLKRKGEYSETLILDEKERSNPRFDKLVRSAEKLIKKTEGMYQKLEQQKAMQSGEVKNQMSTIQKKLKRLQKFLSELFVNPKPEKLYWLRFNSDWVDLYSAPSKLDGIVSNFHKSLSALSIVDTMLPKRSMDYFETRLGLSGFEQKELALGADAEKIKVSFLSEEFTPEVVARSISQHDGSTIVVLPNERQLQKFFESFTPDEKLSEGLISYKYSGGLGNVRQKLKNRVTDKKDFIFLLTMNAAVRFFKDFPPAQNLFVQKIPFEAPSAASPARKISEAGSDFLENALPRALLILNLILSRFADSNLGKRQQIIFGDQRIKTDYDRSFLEYLQNLSGVEVEL